MKSTSTMPNKEGTLNSSYFTKRTERTGADIFKDRVIATKNKRSARKSIEYGIHYVLSTKAINIKFAVSSHLIPELCEGETGSDNTWY